MIEEDHKEIARLQAIVARQADLIAYLYHVLGRAPDAMEREMLASPTDEELRRRRQMLDSAARAANIPPRPAGD